VFEFRMGKMMDMALRAAGGAKVDTARLTVEEREMYDEVFALLKERRESLLESQRSHTMEEEEPTLGEAVVPAMVVEARIEEIGPPQPARPEAVSVDRGTSVLDVPPVVMAPAPRPSEGDGAPVQPDYVVVRILENIPAFAGPGRNYRLVKEDLVSLPPAIARALVARKKAVGVSTFPGLTPRSSADRRP
jgi:DNA replication factor GINS